MLCACLTGALAAAKTQEAERLAEELAALQEQRASSQPDDDTAQQPAALPRPAVSGAAPDEAPAAPPRRGSWFGFSGSQPQVVEVLLVPPLQGRVCLHVVKRQQINQHSVDKSICSDC